MPWEPDKPCAHPRCPNLVPATGRYCPDHRHLETQQYDRDRPSSGRRGYGARWRKVRRIQLAREPLCRSCQAMQRMTEATEVDHIVPVREGGTDEPANLQSLCKPCHSSKTAREDNRWRRRQRGKPQP